MALTQMVVMALVFVILVNGSTITYIGALLGCVGEQRDYDAHYADNTIWPRAEP